MRGFGCFYSLSITKDAKQTISFRFNTKKRELLESGIPRLSFERIVVFCSRALPMDRQYSLVNSCDV